MNQQIDDGDDGMLFECPSCKDPLTTFHLTGPFVPIMTGGGDPELDDIDIMDDYYLEKTICFCESCQHTALLREFIKRTES